MNEPQDPPLPKLPPRAAESHKGDYGRLLLIGGSRGMTGAITLSGLAALRGGAGLVSIATPRSCQSLVAVAEPSYMTLGWPDDDEGRLDESARDCLEPMLSRFDVIAVGPGLGRSEALDALVGWLYESAPQPLIVDADGLNALAHFGVKTPPAPRVLTPHPGEFHRLAGDDGAGNRSRADLESYAFAWAAQRGVVLVLKGHRTLITDGNRAVRNSTGNPGMATGGCGDVLTGLVAALACRLPPFEAAQLAVHAHGVAGDLAAAELGQESLIASDLPRYLGQALR